jgi:hypothetical protein
MTRWVVCAGLALLASVGAVGAADTEARDYAVLVGGKTAGEAHIAITRQNNGVVEVRCDTDIKVTAVLVTYKYSYRGVETWKSGRLVSFSSNCNDNGKRFVVSAAAEAKGVRVRTNGVEHMARHEVWLTSYWSLPDAKLRNQLIPILDADTGKDLDGRLQFVATEQRTVAGQVVNLNHYRLSGKVSADFWYDGSERLVRQEWVEQGHRTVLELIRLRRS